MKKYILLVFIFALISLFFGCEDRSDVTAPAKSAIQGSADFTRFVSIGNSLTAGLQNNALYESAQKYSYGRLIAQQVGVNYAVPWVSEPGIPAGRIEVRELYPDLKTYYNPASGVPTNLTYPAPYNNLGIPGSTLYDVLNAKDSMTCYSAKFAGRPNPMFNLVLRNLGTQYEQAKMLNPTFISLWVGNNDILGYATQGAVGAYTPTVQFDLMFRQLADSIAKLNAKVVVANIPDMVFCPYFTTVGGSLFLKNIKVLWGVNGNKDTIPMSTLTNYFTLPSQAVIAAGAGQTKANPVPNQYILDSLEVLTVRNVINQYNAIISAVASSKNFALVDMYSKMTQLATQGLESNGLKFNAKFIEGGFFSLDGVHPTSRGQGIIANEFIKAINVKFGANIPLVNVSTIPGSLNFTK